MKEYAQKYWFYAASLIILRICFEKTGINFPGFCRSKNFVYFEDKLDLQSSLFGTDKVWKHSEGVWGKHCFCNN